MIAEIKRNAIEVDNYQFLDDYVRDKQIVLLGENGPGVGDYFSEKLEIIKYLHEQHQFNVVIFENGLIESMMSQQRAELERPELILQQHFIGIYHNEEMLPLFQEPWAKHLHITGMDVQPMYREASNYYIETIRSKLNEDTYELLQKAEEKFFQLDELLLKTKKIKNLKPLTHSYIQAYKDILKEAHHIDDPTHAMLFEKFVQNRIDWLHLNLKGMFSSGTRAKYMYKNVEWLLQYYHGEKFIIWGRNFHIQKGQTMLNKLLRIENVGYSLQKMNEDKCFTLGLYAGSGRYASLHREEFDVQLTHKDHLEKVCNDISRKAVFLPFANTAFSAEKWVLSEAGIGRNYPKRLIPQKHYDAIICFKNVRPPIYLRYNNMFGSY